MTARLKQLNWNLVMSKKRLLSILIACLAVIPAYTKGLEVWGKPYTQILSFNNLVTNGFYTVAITEQDGQILDTQNWRITVRLNGNIVSAWENKVFPSNKIGFVLTSTSGQPSANIPSVNDISLTYPVMLNGTQEVELINGTNARLTNKVGGTYNYMQFLLNFQLFVMGGGYLSVLDADNPIPGGISHLAYLAPIEFKLYIDGEVFSYPLNYDILHVFPLSTTQSYSILVDPVNVDLEFNTVADYINGKNETYTNALTVQSYVDYQLRVSSIYPNFSSASGSTLPLDIVRLQLSDNNQTTTPKAITETMVTLITGASTGNNTKKYNMIFSTGADDSRLFNLPSQLYSTDLLFEITPQ